MDTNTDSMLSNDACCSTITFESVMATMQEVRAEVPQPLPRRIFVASDIYGMAILLRDDPIHAPFWESMEIVESPLMPAGKWMKETDLPNRRIDWVRSAPFMRGPLS